MRVLVVGAGMAGLTCARELEATGHRVTVVDKGRTVGGRMASRRHAGARFDHGAQHFSVRSPDFANLVEGLRAAGVVRTWFEAQSLTEPGRGVEPRHVGHPAMRSICEHLARGLDVRTATHVDQVRIEDGGVVAVTDGGERIAADAAVVTAPAPQTVRILRDVELGAVGDALARIDYHPCLAAMVALDGPSALPEGHLASDDEAVAWIADNHHKGVSPIPAVTIHSTPDFARERLDEPPEAWLPDLVAAARAHLAGAVTEASGHRWRYSLPTNPTTDGALRAPGEVPVVVAGEAFSGARVEGAFLSGRAAARVLLNGQPAG